MAQGTENNPGLILKNLLSEVSYRTIYPPYNVQNIDKDYFYVGKIDSSIKNAVLRANFITLNEDEKYVSDKSIFQSQFSSEVFFSIANLPLSRIADGTSVGALIFGVSGVPANSHYQSMQSIYIATYDVHSSSIKFKDVLLVERRCCEGWMIYNRTCVIYGQDKIELKIAYIPAKDEVEELGSELIRMASISAKGEITFVEVPRKK